MNRRKTIFKDPRLMNRLLSIFLYSFIAMTSVSAKIDKAEFESIDRLVVVGDVHGDFERFKAVLKSANLIDSKLRWTGGKTHLVQMGDLPDRGPDTREIIEFLFKLEKSASRAGGHVHILIGNHDAMNMYGDLRYVTTEEFEAFRTPNSTKLLERYFEAEIAWIKRNTPKEEWPIFDETFREDWFSDKPPGYIEHRQNWMPDGKIGKWVRTKNAVLKIGDTLFVHAGISETFAQSSIKEINRTVRGNLANIDETEGFILDREDGPLWYRGLAMGPEDTHEELLQSVLDNFDVKRIVLGHTPTPGVIVPRFNGRVIIADVGLSRYYGNHLACLEISNGTLFAIHRGKRLPLPLKRDESYLNYLDAISELEAGHEDTQRWIEQQKHELAKDAEGMPNGTE
jgi:calcineurin-like phosphoesterase family protein